MNKKIFSFTLALFILLSVVVSPISQVWADTLEDFKDVPYGHQFYEFVMHLAEEGIVGGYSNGNYGVGDPITRSQVAKTLAVALELPIDENAKNTDVFNDTNGHSLEKYIVAVKEAGIFGGDKGYFYPQEPITRAQVAKVVVNAFGIEPNLNYIVTFSDIDNTHWAWEWINALSSNKIVNGYSDGEFKPGESVTRGQYAKYVSNSIKLPQEPIVIEKTYILNTNTMKFHYPGCFSVKKIADENKEESDLTREELIDLGYSPCGNCKP